MSVKLSTGLKNAWLGGGGGGGSLVNILRNGVMRIYSGSQPANADAVETGTLLLEISASSGAFSAGVSSDVELTFAGAAGSVDTIKVGGLDENLLDAAVSFDTDLATTATAVAASINGKPNALGIKAVANSPSNGDVMLYAPAFLGALADNLTVAVTTTTMTVDIDNAASPSTSETGVFAGGTTASNGLNFDVAASGAISKDSGETWSDAGIADGVAGWARFYDCEQDTGASTTAKRLDMNVGTVGTDVIMDSTTVATGATSTVVSASLSL